MTQRLFHILALVVLVGVPAPAQDEVVHFAAIGDMGTGGDRQREVGGVMEKVRAERFPFTFVITLGDNLYGSQDAADFQRKFVVPYKALLDAKVMFFAALGNHDSPSQRTYELFNMNDQRYYTYTRGPAQFYALDSTTMNAEQLRWLEDELQRSTAPWKIAYLHHPLYSSGKRHGPSMVLRQALEPLLEKYRVQAVFAGHEHFYERHTPQKGVQHFISGAGGQLRLLNVNRTKDTAAAFDTDNSFMAVRIKGDELYFEAISRRGVTVDAGVIDRTRGTRPASTTTSGQ
jgi:3',5'-cyclic AMP phosphodiesterase CpdA